MGYMERWVLYNGDRDLTVLKTGIGDVAEIQMSIISGIESARNASGRRSKNFSLGIRS